MIKEDIYEQVYQDSLAKVLESVVRDLGSEEFHWERFLASMVEDGSPLEDVFSTKTLHLAELHLLAMQIREKNTNVDETMIIIPEEKGSDT